MARLPRALAAVMATVVMAVGLLAACAGGPAAPAEADRTGWPTSLTFAGPSIGGTPHIVATAYGNMIGQQLGLTWNFQPGVASLAAIELMANGNIDINTTTNGDTLYFAPRGTGPMEGKKATNIRILFPTLIQGYLILTRSADNIKGIADIKGKRLTWQSTSWLSTTFAENLLGSAGLKWEDIQKVPATQISSAISLMSDRKTDMMAWVDNTMVSSPTLAELTRLVDISLVPVSQAQQKYVVERMPYLSTGELKAGIYKGQDKAVPLVQVDQAFGIRQQLPDSLVYALMKVAFDRNDEFRAGHPLMGHITAEWSLKTALPGAWHAGGVRYWKEKGLWTKELDARQQALLSEVGQSK